MCPSSGLRCLVQGCSDERLTEGLQVTHSTVQQSPWRSVSNRSYWHVVLMQAPARGSDSPTRPESSIPISGGFDKQTFQETVEALSTFAMHEHQDISNACSKSGRHSDSLHLTKSDSAISNRDGPSHESNCERRSRIDSHPSSDQDSLTAATDDRPALRAAVALRSRRTRYQLTERLYTCDKDTPLRIGRNNRSARDVVEEICQSSPLAPNVREKLLGLVEAFEKTYKPSRAPRGAGDARRTVRERESFRKGILRLLASLSGDGVRGWRKPLARIAELESKAKGIMAQPDSMK
jgi:hypothetical protein